MFSFLKRSGSSGLPLTTDVHSHLLAGIDDGVQTVEEAVAVIRVFQEFGYRKLITTPHVMQDYYRNTPEIIASRLAELRKVLAERRVDIEVEAAAEYYLDETMIARVENKEPFLTFGQRLLLFETNMINEPYQLKEFIFQISMQGYKPVLAHPERYAYMTLEKAEDLRDRGVLLQINLPSIAGYYSRPVQRLAHQLIDRGWVDLLGSDCHNRQHADIIPVVQKNKYYQKALALPLLNPNL